MLKELKQRIKENSREFKRARKEYIFLLLNSGLVTSGILMSFCSFIAGWVLKKAGIPYVTHTTIPMFLQQPWTIIVMLLLLLLVVYIAYFQYSIILQGMRDIKNNNYSFKKSFIDGINILFHTPPKAMLVLALYIMLALPLAGLMTTSDIFSKVQIPKFISDFMLGKWYLAVILLTIYLGAIVVAIKYIYVLPYAVLKKQDVKEALQNSAKMTKGKMGQIFWKFIYISIKFAITQFIVLLLAFIVQLLVDELLPNYADFSAMALLSIITMFEMYYPLRVVVITVYTIIPDEFFEYTEEMQAARVTSKKEKKKHIVPLILLVLLTIVFSVAYSYYYVFNLFLTSPLVISHRGVDGENGVQNTIPALEATVKSSHPDYVEIDIHETKDGKFVMMHDENLKALCGVDAKPHDLTLEELTKLDVSENGFTAKVCSFDDYLKRADELGQPLLIEIKGTSSDSEDMVQRFISQYGADIIENGHILHSMQYYIVEEICGSDLIGHEKEAMTYEDVPLYMGCIIPFNLLYPHTNADAYTMEETTINPSIIFEALQEGKAVYAWTVNEVTDMRQMAILGVDGIITDEPSMLRDTLESMYASGYASLVAEKLVDTLT